MGRQQNSNSVTAALERCGVGRYQHFLLVYTGLAWAADAMETMLLSYLGPAAACAWPSTVGPAAQSLLTSVVFAGMLVGVYCLGAVSDGLGRRKGFFLSAALLGTAGLASAMSPSFAVCL
jgi:MFS family permease